MMTLYCVCMRACACTRTIRLKKL